MNSLWTYICKLMKLQNAHIYLHSILDSLYGNCSSSTSLFSVTFELFLFALCAIPADEKTDKISKCLQSFVPIYITDVSNFLQSSSGFLTSPLSLPWKNGFIEILQYALWKFPNLAGKISEEAVFPLLDSDKG